jgi:hypothetical protein
MILPSRQGLGSRVLRDVVRCTTPQEHGSVSDFLRSEASRSFVLRRQQAVLKGKSDNSNIQ